MIKFCHALNFLLTQIIFSVIYQLVVSSFIAAVIALYHLLLLILLLIHFLLHGICGAHNVFIVPSRLLLHLRYLLLLKILHRHVTATTVVLLVILYSLISWYRYIVVHVETCTVVMGLLVSSCVVNIFLGLLLKTINIANYLRLSRKPMLHRSVFIDVLIILVVLFLQSWPAFFRVRYFLLLSALVKECLWLGWLRVLLHVDVTIVLHLALEHARFLW